MSSEILTFCKNPFTLLIVKFIINLRWDVRMKRLRELRTNVGLSMKEFGSIIGLAESTISLYETGKREPDFNTLAKIANYFNVTIDYLLGNTERIHLSISADRSLCSAISSAMAISTGRSGTSPFKKAFTLSAVFIL